MNLSANEKRRALLLVDHGSRREEAHEQLVKIAERLQQHLHADSAQIIVEIAHMDIIEPNIEEGFSACVSRGASHVTVIPCLLSRGRHVSEHIPQLVRDAASRYGVEFHLAAPLSEQEGFINLLCSAAQLPKN